MSGEFEARRSIVEIGRRLWLRGYVAANDGNLSVRIADERLLVTPAGVSKGFLAPDDLVVVDLEGRRLQGRLDPTSELGMHLFVMRARPDVGGIVHAHPPKATGFAVAGVPLAQCTLPEVILSLGSVPLAPYATPSTGEVARSVADYIGTHSALVLRNHGVLTVGSDIHQAYFRMETVEHLAAITLAARALGGESPLSREDVRKLLKVREKLGVSSPPDACEHCGACAGRADARAGAFPRETPSEGPVAAVLRAPLPQARAATPRAESEEEIVRAVLAEVEKALRGL